MIHLWALHLANEFMPLSLGAEDLVIHKMMPLSANLMPRRGRERNPCSASLVLVSPFSCAWCCKRAGHRLALTLLCSRAALLFQSLWGQEGPRCTMKNPHTFVLSQIRAAFPVTVQKAPSLIQLGRKLSGMGFPILHLNVEQGWISGWNTVKRRLDFGCSWAKEVILHLWCGQGTNPYGCNITQVASNFVKDRMPSIPIYFWAISHHARAASQLWFRTPEVLPTTCTPIMDMWQT